MVVRECNPKLGYCVSMTQKLTGIGRRIRHYRKREGLSAQELADFAGMSRSVIANMESGRRDDITVSELLAIARALRVPPVAVLFDISNPMAAAPVVSGDPDGGIYPRLVDYLDWVAGMDGPAQWDEERMQMERDLTENGPAVMPMTGLILEAAYSEGGWEAIQLLAAGRQLRNAVDRYSTVSREFFTDLRLGTFGWETTGAENAEVGMLVESGSASESKAALSGIIEKARSSGDEYGKLAERAVHRMETAMKDVLHARGLLKSLGGRTGPRDEESEFAPVLGYNQVLSLWTGIRFKYMSDLIEGGLDLNKYRSLDQIHRAIDAGKLKIKKDRGEAFGEHPEEA